jgi:hypothetical protein
MGMDLEIAECKLCEELVLCTVLANSNQRFFLKK